jgi:hypothetical protein
MKRISGTPKTSKKAKPTPPKKSFYAVPRPLVSYRSGFPKQLAITHKWNHVGALTFTPTTSNVVYLPFGVNCLYDPYLALGGSQPLYFDQMTDIYNHYTVMKSRIKVSIVPNTVDAFVGGIMIDDDDSPSVTSLSIMMSQPSTVFKTSHRDVECLTLYKNWDCKSVFGPNPLDNDRLQGNVGANPAEIQSFIVFMRPLNIAAGPIEFDIMVTIEFDTVWNELKAIAGS